MGLMAEGEEGAVARGVNSVSREVVEKIAAAAAREVPGVVEMGGHQGQPEVGRQPPQQVEQGHRVRAAGDEARHGAVGPDQPVAADMRPHPVLERPRLHDGSVQNPGAARPGQASANRGSADQRRSVSAAVAAASASTRYGVACRTGCVWAEGNTPSAASST